MIELNLDSLIEKYVVPFRENKKNQKKILQEIYLEKNINSIVELLLTEKGWRNRKFATICVGKFKLENFVDQIYKQAFEMNDFHTAESYSFALVTINSDKSVKYLKELSELNTTDTEYTKNVQKWYKAGLIIVENLICNDDDLSLFVEKIKTTIDNLNFKIY